MIDHYIFNPKTFQTHLVLYLCDEKSCLLSNEIPFYYLTLLYQKDETRVICRSTHEKWVLSTVFLPADHNYTGKGLPLVFETMLFFQSKVGRFIEVDGCNSEPVLYNNLCYRASTPANVMRYHSLILGRLSNLFETCDFGHLFNNGERLLPISKLPKPPYTDRATYFGNPYVIVEGDSFSELDFVRATERWKTVKNYRTIPKDRSKEIEAFYDLLR